MFGAILADPPWEQAVSRQYDTPKNKRPDRLAYQTMPVAEIAALPVASIAAEQAHLWLWTTNSFLRAGFDVMEAWGFKYLAPVVWVKPSGMGNFFVHRTQTLLFGYRGKLRMAERYLSNVVEAGAREHSEKPMIFHRLVERVSSGERCELFARRIRPGWTCLGNEIDGMDIRDAIDQVARRVFA